MGNIWVVSLQQSVSGIKLALQGLDADGSDRIRWQAVVQTLIKLRVVLVSLPPKQLISSQGLCLTVPIKIEGRHRWYGHMNSC
jgi:hypothetical protein